MTTDASASIYSSWVFILLAAGAMLAGAPAFTDDTPDKSKYKFDFRRLQAHFRKTNMYCPDQLILPLVGFNQRNQRRRAIFSDDVNQHGTQALSFAGRKATTSLALAAAEGLPC
jgi:hypothetical protein